MDNNKKLSEELLKADGIDPANIPDTERKIFRQSLDKHLNSRQSKQVLWRIIMKNNITKYAAAAVIIIAAIIIINQFGGSIDGASIAWGNLAQKYESVDSFMFGLTIKVSEPNNEEPIEQITSRWIIYLSREYGFRMDIGTSEEFVSWYVAPDANEMIMVIPSEKQIINWPLSEDMQNQMPKEYEDPREYITRFMSRPYKKLGRSTIDGIRVEGIEVMDPPTKGENLINAVGRLWVDIETELPVRIEIEGMAGTMDVQWIMDFRWAEEVAPELFDPHRAIGSNSVNS